MNLLLNPVYMSLTEEEKGQLQPIIQKIQLAMASKYIKALTDNWRKSGIIKGLSTKQKTLVMHDLFNEMTNKYKTEAFQRLIQKHSSSDPAIAGSAEVSTERMLSADIPVLAEKLRDIVVVCFLSVAINFRHPENTHLQSIAEHLLAIDFDTHLMSAYLTDAQRALLTVEEFALLKRLFPEYRLVREPNYRQLVHEIISLSDLQVQNLFIVWLNQMLAEQVNPEPRVVEKAESILSCTVAITCENPQIENISIIIPQKNMLDGLLTCFDFSSQAFDFFATASMEQLPPIFRIAQSREGDVIHYAEERLIRAVVAQKNNDYHFLFLSGSAYQPYFMQANSAGVSELQSLNNSSNPEINEIFQDHLRLLIQKNHHGLTPIQLGITRDRRTVIPFVHHILSCSDEVIWLKELKAQLKKDVLEVLASTRNETSWELARVLLGTKMLHADDFLASANTRYKNNLLHSMMFAGNIELFSILMNGVGFTQTEQTVHLLAAVNSDKKTARALAPEVEVLAAHSTLTQAEIAALLQQLERLQEKKELLKRINLNKKLTEKLFLFVRTSDFARQHSIRAIRLSENQEQKIVDDFIESIGLTSVDDIPDVVARFYRFRVAALVPLTNRSIQYTQKTITPEESEQQLQDFDKEYQKRYGSPVKIPLNWDIMNADSSVEELNLRVLHALYGMVTDVVTTTLMSDSLRKVAAVLIMRLAQFNQEHSCIVSRPLVAGILKQARSSCFNELIFKHGFSPASLDFLIKLFSYTGSLEHLILSTNIIQYLPNYRELTTHEGWAAVNCENVLRALLDQKFPLEDFYTLFKGTAVYLITQGNLGSLSYKLQEICTTVELYQVNPSSADYLQKLNTLTYSTIGEVLIHLMATYWRRKSPELQELIALTNGLCQNLKKFVDVTMAEKKIAQHFKFSIAEAANENVIKLLRTMGMQEQGPLTYLDMFTEAERRIIASIDPSRADRPALLHHIHHNITALRAVTSDVEEQAALDRALARLAERMSTAEPLAIDTAPPIIPVIFNHATKSEASLNKIMASGFLKTPEEVGSKGTPNPGNRFAYGTLSRAGRPRHTQHVTGQGFLKEAVHVIGIPTADLEKISVVHTAAHHTGLVTQRFNNTVSISTPAGRHEYKVYHQKVYYPLGNRDVVVRLFQFTGADGIIHKKSLIESYEETYTQTIKHVHYRFIYFLRMMHVPVDALSMDEVNQLFDAVMNVYDCEAKVAEGINLSTVAHESLIDGFYLAHQAAPAPDTMLEAINAHDVVRMNQLLDAGVDIHASNSEKYLPGAFLRAVIEKMKTAIIAKEDINIYIDLLEILLVRGSQSLVSPSIRYPANLDAFEFTDKGYNSSADTLIWLFVTCQNDRLRWLIARSLANPMTVYQVAKHFAPDIASWIRQTSSTELLSQTRLPDLTAANFVAFLAAAPSVYELPANDGTPQGIDAFALISPSLNVLRPMQKTGYLVTEILNKFQNKELVSYSHLSCAFDRLMVADYFFAAVCLKLIFEQYLTCAEDSSAAEKKHFYDNITNLLSIKQIPRLLTEHYPGLFQSIVPRHIFMSLHYKSTVNVNIYSFGPRTLSFWDSNYSLLGPMLDTINVKADYTFFVAKFIGKSNTFKDELAPAVAQEALRVLNALCEQAQHDTYKLSSCWKIMAFIMILDVTKHPEMHDVFDAFVESIPQEIRDSRPRTIIMGEFLFRKKGVAQAETAPATEVKEPAVKKKRQTKKSEAPNPQGFFSATSAVAGPASDEPATKTKSTP